MCHFPPGTSQWDKIKHCLVGFITKNWRGRPLVSDRTVVHLNACTTTRTGLRVRAALDTARDGTGIVVTDEELACVTRAPGSFPGAWNDPIHPSRQMDQVAVSRSLTSSSHDPATPKLSAGARHPPARS